jgi:carbonic anhydrase
VLQYAVDFLKIKHVIVTGHYGCGGIKAAMESKTHGLVDNWLRHVRDTNRRYQEELDQIGDYSKRLRRLCELNVVEQVINVGNTTIIQDAWSRGQNIDVHGWIYDISNGLVNDLNVGINSSEGLDDLQIQTANSQTHRTIKLPIKRTNGVKK